MLYMRTVLILLWGYWESVEYSQISGNWYATKIHYRQLQVRIKRCSHVHFNFEGVYRSILSYVRQSPLTLKRIADGKKVHSVVEWFSHQYFRSELLSTRAFHTICLFYLWWHSKSRVWSWIKSGGRWFDDSYTGSIHISASNNLSHYEWKHW